jgi:hypothetical protein
MSSDGWEKQKEQEQEQNLYMLKNNNNLCVFLICLRNTCHLVGADTHHC